VLAILGIAGCSRPLPRERLIGSYRADYGYGVEQLTLRADGTYTQGFAAKGEALRAINQRRFDLGTGDYWDRQLLQLHDPVVIDDLGKRPAMTRSSGVWAMRVRQTQAGQPRLLINEDMGLEFNRVKSTVRASSALTNTSNYFRSTSDLAGAVWLRIASSFMPGVMQMLASDLSLDEKIDRFVDAHHDRLTRHPYLLAYVQRSSPRGDALYGRNFLMNKLVPPSTTGQGFLA
jgi:hypothetical protein